MADALYKCIITQHDNVFVRYLHEVHGENAMRAGHVCPSAYFNSRTTGRIRMEFAKGVVPWGSASKSYC